MNFDDIIKAVVESTTDKQSNETIGRDLIRILSLEYTYNAICYSVSDNTSDIDSDKHTEIDFNNRHFCSRLKEKYNGIKFEQIILDYFWSPPGEWQRKHWKKELFGVTIPNLIREDLLHSSGSIYIPFSMHCLEQIVIFYSILSDLFRIEFLSHDRLLKENKLYMTTNKIGENVMKYHLIKNFNIQDNYCSINPSNVNQEISDSSIAVKVKEILNRIGEVDKVRMIKFSRIKQDENDVGKGRKGFMLNKVKH